MKVVSTGTKRPGGSTNPILLAILGVAVLVAVVVGVLVLRAGRYDCIHESLAYELGAGVPDASLFLSGKAGPDDYLSYVTETSTLDVSKPGTHEIQLLLNGRHKLKAQLIIADTTAPTADGIETTITVSETLGPDELCANLKDASVVALSWEEQPEFGSVGDYNAVIKLTDESGNSSTVTSLVHIRAVIGEVVMEAGGEIPTAADFLMGSNPDAAFVSDIASYTLNVPGSYEVTVSAAGKEYASTLIVQDTTPPVLVTQTVLAAPGNTPGPEDFIVSAEDATELGFEYATSPDFSATGVQTVVIRATDMGGNVTETPAELIISDLEPVDIELRHTALKAEELVEDATLYTSLALRDAFVPETAGVFAVYLIADGAERMVVVTVADTTDPAGSPVELTGYLDHPIAADEFVSDISDCTAVTVSFKSEPDWSREGESDVTVILTDAAGNSSRVTSTLTLVPDAEAPSIYGVFDRYCYLDEAVSYFAEVFAEDNCDDTVELTVDNSAVNIHALGEYSVTYSATDSAGNTATASCTFTVIENTITDEELQAVADKVMAEITTEDMDVPHKLLAIHDYVRDHITYNSYSDKTNWKVEAKRGIEEGLGDCFTFYAVAHLLLLQVDDIEIMTVERLRKGTDTMHFWHLVNDGTGWYHFDAFATQSGWRCFMRTSEETYGWSSYFWRYDASLYPEVSDELYFLDSEGELRAE